MTIIVVFKVLVVKKKTKITIMNGGIWNDKER